MQWLEKTNKEGGTAIRKYNTTIILSVVLTVLSACSLFIGVLDVDVTGLSGGNINQWKILWISRLPRLLANAGAL